MSASTPHITGSYVAPSLEHATVADAMHPGIISCDRETPVTDMARIMASRHVHCIVVRDVSAWQPNMPFTWGIVSDRSLVEAGLRTGAEPTAADIADPPTANVELTMALRDAARLMVDEDTSHVIVVEPGSGRPVGILSTLDIAGVLAWGEA